MMFEFVSYIVKHIAIHVPLIVACPVPGPLWSNGTLAYWVSPESSKRHKEVASS
jgi:hypothetical protein